MLYDDIIALGHRVYNNPSILMASSLSHRVTYIEDKNTGVTELLGDKGVGAVKSINTNLPSGIERIQVDLDFSKSNSNKYLYSGIRYSLLFNHMMRIVLSCSSDYYIETCEKSPQDVLSLSHCLIFNLLDIHPERGSLNVLDFFSPIVRFTICDRINHNEGSKIYIDAYNREETNLADRVILPAIINSRCLLNYELTAPNKDEYRKLTVQELYSNVNHFITSDKFIYDFSSYSKGILIDKLENLKTEGIKIDLMNYNLSNIAIDVHEGTLDEDLELFRYLYENTDSLIYATKLCYGINCVDIQSVETYDRIFNFLRDMGTAILKYQNADLLMNFNLNSHLSSYMRERDEWSKLNNRLSVRKIPFISNEKTLVVKTGLHRLRKYFETIYFSNLLISNVQLTYETQKVETMEFIN